MSITGYVNVRVKNGVIIIICTNTQNKLLQFAADCIYDTSVYIVYTLEDHYSVANCDSCLVKKSVLGGRNLSM